VCLPETRSSVFGVWLGLVGWWVPLAHPVLYPRRRKLWRATYIAFAENQLSPSLIGLSPLATSHPLLFQQEWVRPSSKCYLTFSLLMARSPGFGSNPSNSGALFRLAFAAPTPHGLSLLDRLTRWPIIQKVRGHPEGLPLLVSVRFQVSFTPLDGVLFTFPSRYLFAIGR